jgi:hypothetical protein
MFYIVLIVIVGQVFSAEPSMSIADADIGPQDAARLKKFEQVFGGILMKAGLPKAEFRPLVGHDAQIGEFSWRLQWQDDVVTGYWLKPVEEKVYAADHVNILRDAANACEGRLDTNEERYLDGKSIMVKSQLFGCNKSGKIFYSNFLLLTHAGETVLVMHESSRQIGHVQAIHENLSIVLFEFYEKHLNKIKEEG